MNAVVLQETVQAGVVSVAGWVVLVASLALAVGWALYLMR